MKIKTKNGSLILKKSLFSDRLEIIDECEAGKFNFSFRKRNVEGVWRPYIKNSEGELIHQVIIQVCGQQHGYALDSLKSAISLYNWLK